MLVVLHDLTLASRFCNRIVLLYEGRVATHGPTQTVLCPANLARYYAIRADIVPTAHGHFIIPIERLREQDAGSH